MTAAGTLGGPELASSTAAKAWAPFSPTAEPPPAESSVKAEAGFSANALAMAEASSSKAATAGGA